MIQRVNIKTRYCRESLKLTHDVLQIQEIAYS